MAGGCMAVMHHVWASSLCLSSQAWLYHSHGMQKAAYIRLQDARRGGGEALVENNREVLIVI